MVDRSMELLARGKPEHDIDADVAGIELRPCRSPRRFLNAQRQFYKGDPNYVPPLTLVDRWRLTPWAGAYLRSNDAAFVLASHNGQIVGRISVTRNRSHDQYHGEQVGFFGHFEARDEASACVLLDYAAGWSRARGATVLRGPVDLSTNYRCGLLVEGEAGPPMVLMPYNPPQYCRYLVKYGLREAKNLLAFHITRDTLKLDSFVAQIERLRKRTSIHIRPIQFRRFSQELHLLAGLYNRIWAGNWGFSPMSLKEFRQEMAGLPVICPPELFQIALIGDEAVGMILALPDINTCIQACDGRLLHPAGWKFFRELRRTRRLRLLLMGIVPEHRKSGADAMMVHRIMEELIARGFEECEAGWVLENNLPMRRMLERLGATVRRRYSIFEMSL